MGKFVEELVRKAMFFKFANSYAVDHKTLPNDFQVSDALLHDFEHYLKEKNFEYQEDSEIKLKELKDIATKERYQKSFLQDVDQLEAMIGKEKERTTQRYQKEMRSYLRAEIEGRINGDKAEIESTFPDDRQLQAAVGVLKNTRVYDNLLAVAPAKNTGGNQ